MTADWPRWPSATDHHRCQQARGQALARPADPRPPLPRRIAADYCRCCGGTVQHWPGCDGGAT